jgi:hypothetical protein
MCSMLSWRWVKMKYEPIEIRVTERDGRFALTDAADVDILVASYNGISQH